LPGGTGHDSARTSPGLEVVALGSDSLAGEPASALDVRLNGSLPSLVSNEDALGDVHELEVQGERAQHARLPVERQRLARGPELVAPSPRAGRTREGAPEHVSEQPHVAPKRLHRPSVGAVHVRNRTRRCRAKHRAPFEHCQARSTDGILALR